MDRNSDITKRTESMSDRACTPAAWWTPSTIATDVANAEKYFGTHVRTLRSARPSTTQR